MSIIELKTTVNENDEIVLRVPRELRGQNVTVRIEPTIPVPVSTQNESAWTEAEIETMLASHPKTGSDIAKSDAIGGWDHLGITDSVAFVESLRRKRKERQWHRD